MTDLIHAELVKKTLNPPPPVKPCSPKSSKPPEDKFTEHTPVEVHFNPSTLRLSYTNQFGDGKPYSHARETVAKLDVELIFDTTQTGKSVMAVLGQLTAMTRSDAVAPAQPSSGAQQPPSGKVPVVEFRWCGKVFEGVIESMSQTIEYWSLEGVPMRATVQLSLKETSKSDPDLKKEAKAVDPGKFAFTPVTPTPATGDKPATDAATKGGNPAAGRSIAAFNGLESMRGGIGGAVGASAGASVGAGASAGAGASVSLGVAASVNLGAAAGFAASGGVSAGAGAGASLGFGLGASAGASAGAGLGAAAGIGMAGGASIGAGAGIGIGASAGVGIGAGAGVGVGAGASAGAFAGASAGAFAGASAGAFAGAAAGAFAGASASASAGAFAGASARASAGASASASAGAFAGSSASAGRSAAEGAFAGLGQSRTIGGNTGIDPARLIPPPPPAPIGARAVFDSTGRLVSDGSTAVAAGYVRIF